MWPGTGIYYYRDEGDYKVDFLIKDNLNTTQGRGGVHRHVRFYGTAASLPPSISSYGTLIINNTQGVGAQSHFQQIVNVTSSASEWSRISSSPFGQNVEVFSVTGQVLAIELMRKSEVFKRFTVNYWRDIQKKEVDFVIKDGIRTRQLIQVTYASSKETIKDREIKNLLVASAELKCSDLLVITWDYEAEEKIKGRKIKFVPLWKWLLNI